MKKTKEKNDQRSERAIADLKHSNSRIIMPRPVVFSDKTKYVRQKLPRIEKYDYHEEF